MLTYLIHFFDCDKVLRRLGQLGMTFVVAKRSKAGELESCVLEIDKMIGVGIRNDMLRVVLRQQ